MIASFQLDKGGRISALLELDFDGDLPVSIVRYMDFGKKVLGKNRLRTDFDIRIAACGQSKRK